MKSYRSTFATGLILATTMFVAVLFAPMGAAEAGSLNASSPQQYSQRTIVVAQNTSVAQCKSNCGKAYNRCLSDCRGGSALGGKCTLGEAMAGCNDKYGRKKAACIAGCAN